MGAARTVAVPAKATNRARHRCVALIVVGPAECYCVLLSSSGPGASVERLARSCKAALVPDSLLRSADRCPVKGLHGSHSWRIASSRVLVMQSQHPPAVEDHPVKGSAGDTVTCTADQSLRAQA